jgi:hypothetical protein
MTTAGLCLVAAALIGGALILDWATRDSAKPTPVILGDRKTWRRPRRALVERVAIQCFYLVFTLAAILAALRLAEAI